MSNYTVFLLLESLRHVYLCKVVRQCVVGFVKHTHTTCIKIIMQKVEIGAWGWMFLYLARIKLFNEYFHYVSQIYA